MSCEEYKQYIIEMIHQIDDEKFLRRIYLILMVMMGAGD